MEAIFTRRSIRRYDDRPVEAGAVDKLLAAAMAAPSAGNEQPWEFIVVTDQATREEITRVHPYSQMLRQAPVAIVVCADTARSRYPVDYWIQDCAAATQNILLAAAAIGLGTCWLGVHPVAERVEGVRRLLAIPDTIVPFAIVAVGHPAEQGGRVDRFDPTRIHHERYGR
ncbi:nitroreductase family protein [Anaeroselena agilis]|uniref:Nitroreductase family protein n=1 Tax=Anaeroselena agilis TaxID=3063788 RepID=A0ABU3P069_9FIRM|nr:nitroreductase family protein [Selenomonadales bacterium 4137-cl]